MAYALYTQSFGTANANGEVRIVNSTTNVPAIVMSSATGGVISSNGFATLDASGNLSVYIDTSDTYNVFLTKAYKGGSTNIVKNLALKTLVDVASATVTYTCEAPLGTATSSPAWRVSRATISGNVTLTEWAGGGAWDQIADNRTSLTYS